MNMYMKIINAVYLKTSTFISSHLQTKHECFAYISEASSYVAIVAIVAHSAP